MKIVTVCINREILRIIQTAPRYNQIHLKADHHLRAKTLKKSQIRSLHVKTAHFCHF